MTKASQIMLPTYPIVCSWLGLTYCFTSTEKLVHASPVFLTANTMFPMRGWGVLFLIVSGTQFHALFLQRRLIYMVTLCLMLGMMMVWFIVFVVAVFQVDASPAAPAWPALGMAACVASLRSLSYQEVQK